MVALTLQYSDQGWNQQGKAQIASNVTRISRSLRRQCSDNTLQVVDYQHGVGSGGSIVDILSGGAFGFGISENIRGAYTFVCSNYVDGDDIILIGFSRGAFTARSVAGMISNLGLLTREGMEFFYPIFKDMQNWSTPHYIDPYPGIPFHNKPRGEKAAATYRQMLLDRGLTRVYQNQGKGPLIKIKAVGVWDTVGSLGIPTTSIVERLGLPLSSTEYRFFDTSLSDRIEHAFQALALDEHRPPFTPAVWERTSENHDATDLRQVWFPGNHGNVGGGWADANIANMSLAWMMDQLASVGVEFDELTIERIFTRLVRYYHDTAVNAGQSTQPRILRSTDSDAPEDVLARATAAAADNPKPSGAFSWLNRIFPRSSHWAIEEIYVKNLPVRPWALGALLKDQGSLTAAIYWLAGYDVRSPNMYHRPDPWTAKPTPQFLENTNERMHCSVRVRLALQGLGLNDGRRWDAPALKGLWKLSSTSEHFADPIPETVLTWEPQTDEGIAAVTDSALPAAETGGGIANDGVDPAVGQSKRALIERAVSEQRPLESAKSHNARYIWEYCGPASKAPPQRVLVEEPLGPYERQLLRLAGGTPNVYDVAEGIDVSL